MSNLCTTFQKANVLRREEPLTNDQIFAVAPSIFAADKHMSRSERYTYIPTIEILEKLRKEGFFPFMVAQSRTRNEDKQEYTKHMIRLRHANEISNSLAKEIILINSHDGSSSYQMMAGLYRFVCQNGLVSGDTISDVRIRHSGNISDDIIEASYTILDEFDEVGTDIDTMKATQLSLPEAEAFAEAALTLKYDDDAPISPQSLLIPRRYEDRGLDVWSVFNRIQENLIKGGQRGNSKNGRRITTRPVRAIDNDIKLNKALWIISSAIAKEKSGLLS